MEVFFDVGGFSEEQKSEIDAVFKRVEDGGKEGCWKELPDSIHVKARLKEGRSASDVLLVEARNGSHRMPLVAKVGPMYELKDEWRAFREHLANSSALFAPIRFATPAVLGESAEVQGQKEAVFYDHAARFAGLPDRAPETLEAVARAAIRDGGATLERTEQAIQVLFAGVRNDLYEKFKTVSGESTALEAWNMRLGVALEIEADLYEHKRIPTFRHSGHSGTAERRWPLDLVQAAAQYDSKLEPGAYVEIRDLVAQWRGDRLMGRFANDPLRLEVLTGDRRTASKLAAGLKEGGIFAVFGQVRSLRARSHRAKVDTGLPELAKASLADPFAALPRLLTEERRINRLTALVHGDLNPRNVLLVEDSPLLIDYAFTRAGEPFFLDFTRLEGCLARDILPEDLTLDQHIRLQRLLAAAGRLGQRGADRFAQKLGAERAELGAAFRVLWAIRKAARDIYQKVQGPIAAPWYRDYLEQLFFFAHLSLKWEEQNVPALRATVAMAGVAVENLPGGEFYKYWPAADLRSDGLEILELVEPQDALPDLAAMGRRLPGLGEEADKPLRAKFEQLRADFVRATFANEAKGIKATLEQDHKVYINIRAYINLQGRLHRGRGKESATFESMFEHDEPKAEAPRASGENTTKDVLQLLAEQDAVVLLGDAGGGKSTAVQELQYQLAAVVLGEDKQGLAPRLPLLFRASALREKIVTPEDDRASIAAAIGRESALFDAGVIHLTVDALNELPEEHKLRVASFLVALRKYFPATQVVACHRLYNYTPDLLPFPVVGLEKVEQEQARRYIFNFLQANEVPDCQVLGQRLARILLEDPEHTQVRDLAQTPLFLWMLVENYSQTRVPPSGRGRLFTDFSRWYVEERHHSKRQEPIPPPRFGYEAKAEFLGRVGYVLVEARATDIEKCVVDSWPGAEMLQEILRSELLSLEDGKLRFLHQSFQEYFAARHFLGGEAKDPVALKKRVRTIGWHDTFAVLLGFAGEEPEVVKGVVEAALEVNPELTARCLRMAEIPVEALLERFVEVQEQVLRNPAESGYGHKRAARALAEHGRGRARAALRGLAANATTPAAARVEILRLLPTLPSQARFEPVRSKMLEEFAALLKGIYEEAATEEVLQAAIEAAETAGLKQLGMFLRDFVAPEAPWLVCRAAWKALAFLGFSPSPSLRAAYVRACTSQLDITEAALYKESVYDRMNALNAERLEILEMLASPEHLPLLLRRRFCYAIHEHVDRLLTRVNLGTGQVPEEAQEAWQILREERSDEALERWWQQVHHGSGLEFLAAGHRLAALGEELSHSHLDVLLAAELDSERLAVLAELATSVASWPQIEDLEELVRGLVETISGKREMDAFVRLVMLLETRDPPRGRRLQAIAYVIFLDERKAETEPGVYPWWHFSDLRLEKSDYDFLFSCGDLGAKAAVFSLGMWTGPILTAEEIETLQLEIAAVAGFHQYLGEEKDLVKQRLCANAVVRLGEVSLLSRLLTWSQNEELAARQTETFSSIHGKVVENLLADILRAIGYLTRVLLDQGRSEEATAAIACLHQHLSRLPGAQDRSTVVGCTTGLGYVGEWEPILSHLGPGEPWMHQAAHNIFANWVADDLEERERAARWIARRLRQPELVPEVRSTLGRLLGTLEQEIGRHLGEDLEDEPA